MPTRPRPSSSSSPTTPSVSARSSACAPPPRPDRAGQESEGRTREVCDTLRHASFPELEREWDHAAAAVRAAASRGEPLPFFGGTRPASDLLAYRAFETWIHAGDIAVAI